MVSDEQLYRVIHKPPDYLFCLHTHPPGHTLLQATGGRLAGPVHPFLYEQEWYREDEFYMKNNKLHGRLQ